MEQTHIFPGKLSTINEMTESTGIQQSLDSSAETSINGMELDVAQRITERAVQIRQKMVQCMIVPKLNKTIEKICKKLKIEDEETRSKLQAIERQLEQECHRLLQQRVDDIVDNDPELQNMLSTICDLSVELTDRPGLAELHLPIRKASLEKLTALNATVSETVRRNADLSDDLEQQLKDKEQEANSNRRKLFNVSNCSDACHN